MIAYRALGFMFDMRHLWSKLDKFDVFILVNVLIKADGAYAHNYVTTRCT